MPRPGCSLTTLVAAIIAILLVLAALVMQRGSDPRALSGFGPKPGAAAGFGPKHGGAAAREVQWGQPAPFPQELLAEGLRLVRGRVRASRGFGPASAADRALFAAEARRLSRRYGVPVRGEQLVAVRDMEVALEARTGGVRALRHGPEILAASRGGEAVLAIAERLRLPPMAALRQLLLEGGHSPAAVRALVADPAALPRRLAAEVPAIFEADLGSRLNAERIRARSQAFEDALEGHLRRQGLRFRTEEDLRRAPDGRAPRLTPDFLLDEPVRINGEMVSWIDAKDYPMYGGRLVAQNLIRQAVKYTEAFGPGAMVFSGGLMGGGLAPLPKGLPRPLFLDGSALMPEPI